MTPKYCRNCGNPLNPDTNFCTNCGVESKEQMSSSAYSAPVQHPKTGSKNKPVWMGIVVGILLVVLGVRIPIVMFFGEQTTARINSVERRVDRRVSVKDTVTWYSSPKGSTITKS